MKNFSRLWDWVVLGCLPLALFSALAFLPTVQSSQDQNEATATLNLTANYTADYKSQNRDEVCEDHLTLTYGGAARYKLLPFGYGTSNVHPENLTDYPRAGVHTERTGGFTVSVQGGGNCVNTKGGGERIWTYSARYTAVPPNEFPSIGVQLRPGHYGVGYEFPDSVITAQGQILPGGHDFGSPGGRALGKGANPLDTQQRPNPVAPAQASIPFQAKGPAMFPLLAVMQQSIPKLSAALNGTFPPYSKEFSRSNSASDTFQMPPNNDGQTGTASLNISYTLTVGNPEEVEAVIIPPGDYDKWMPEAGSDEDTPGNGMLVKVVLQKKDKPGQKPQAKAKSFKFELTGVSKEPGVCLNWPPKEKTKKDPDFDLKIDKDGNPSLPQVASDGQSATSGGGLQESSVIVFSYDWGAWGSLKVTAELDNGQTVVAHLQNKPKITELKIPKDDNNNHIADGYEIEGETSAADADDDPLPKGDHTGDTLSYYEEYRGFQVSGDHVRTDNNRKDVFVYDRDHLGLGSFPASGMNIHVLRVDEYTKVEVSDPLHENAKVVNFNHDFAHLGDAHVVMMVNGVAPDEPGRLGETVGGPGPPKKIIAVYVDKWRCLESKWGNLELQDNIAHELAHACNVQHHGERDYEPVDGSIWKRGSDGKWYPMGTPPRHDVAAQHGQHSGSMQCIMRYYRAAYYEHDGGQFRWKRPRGNTGTWTWVAGEAYGPTEVPGTLYCTSQDGDPPNPKTGPTAEDRGFCSEQFCVNDLKH